jgi:hypothetical protein
MPAAAVVSSRSPAAARTLLRAGFALVICLGSGCAFVTQAKLNTSENQNRALLEQRRVLNDEVARLRAHAGRLEGQLLAAERDLAEAGLPVAHSAIAGIGDEATERLVRPADPRPPAPLIADLAQRYPALVLDARRDVLRLDAPLPFSVGGSRLATESQELLQELADLCRTPDAAGLRVLVVGAAPPDDASRRATPAKVAAEFLVRSGLPADRVAVTETSGPATATAGPATAASSPVTVYLLGPDAPVLGWNASASPRR